MTCFTKCLGTSKHVMGLDTKSAKGWDPPARSPAVVTCWRARTLNQPAVKGPE